MKVMIERARLLVKLKSDRIAARKAGDKLKANLLGVIIGEADQLGVNVTVEQVQKIIKSTLKSINERIERKYSDGDLSAALAEAEILKAYMPKEMDDAVLKNLIEDLHTQFNGNVGQIMQRAKTIIAVEGYPFNGKKISEILKQLKG